MNKELIYGCMGLGGEWDDKQPTKEDYLQAEKAIEAALETGIRFFDHADIYKLGKSEQVFGQVLKNNPGLREKITVQSKAGICYHEGMERSNIYDLSKGYLLKQVDGILQRLNTEYLDIFLLHRPDPLMRPSEIAETFAELKQAGKVRAFGVSNMSVAQITLLQNNLDEPLVTNQIQLSLGHALLLDSAVLVNRINSVDYNGVDGMLEYAQTNNLSIQAWSAMDGGRFTGNFDLVSAEDKRTINLIRQLAEKYGTTASAIVLAWLYKIPGNIQPVIGTTNPERIRECKDATSIELAKEDWYDLWIAARGQRIP